MTQSPGQSTVTEASPQLSQGRDFEHTPSRLFSAASSYEKFYQPQLVPVCHIACAVLRLNAIANTLQL